jgi:hypothetical protein
MSVHAYRLQQARAKEATRRNRDKTCICQHVASSVPDVQTKSLGLKRFGGTVHQAYHGTFHTPGCPHSELKATTKRLAQVKRYKPSTSAPRKPKPVAILVVR